jgi:hypothetical protein
MAFLPGGPYLATTEGSALSVWDVDNGRVVRRIGTDDALLGGKFAFTPNGKWLVSSSLLRSTLPGGEGDWKWSMLLWEMSSGKAVMQTDLSDGGAPVCLAIRPDGRVAGCATHFGDVFL